MGTSFKMSRDVQISELCALLQFHSCFMRL